MMSELRRSYSKPPDEVLLSERAKGVRLRTALKLEGEQSLNSVNREHFRPSTTPASMRARPIRQTDEFTGFQEPKARSRKAVSAEDSGTVRSESEAAVDYGEGPDSIEVPRLLPDEYYTPEERRSLNSNSVKSLE